MVGDRIGDNKILDEVGEMEGNKILDEVGGREEVEIVENKIREERNKVGEGMLWGCCAPVDIVGVANTDLANLVGGG